MEENQASKQEENTMQPQEIEKEIEAVAATIKQEPRSISLKGWLMLLTVVFTLSMFSGFYLIFTGGLKQEVKIETKEESSGKFSSSLLKLSSKQEGVAVIKIRGVIEEGTDTGFSSKQSASAIAKRIRALAEKKEIKALLLDINSPGGTVASVQDIYNALLYFKSQGKPVVALFRDVAASGGFYIAMAADKIIAQPGTITGSIGVIMQGANLEGLMEKIGVKMLPIKSGKHKDIGSAFRPMTEEEVALLQDMIDDTYSQFFGVVKAARPKITEADLRIYADGRVFTGSKAKALGLIDDLGGEEKAKEYLTQLTGLKEPKLISVGTGSFFDLLSLSSGGLEGRLGLNKIEEVATPKVSYLWTF